MEQRLLQNTLYGLRIAAVTSAIIIITFFFLSFKTNKQFADIWEQLGVNKKDGMSLIQESMLGGYLQHAGVRNMKNIALGDRKAVTQDLLKFTKEYTESEEFKKAYAKLRAGKKPGEPAKPKTEEMIRKERIESINRGLANAEKSMQTANEEMKKYVKQSQDLLLQQLKEYQDPNSATVKMIVETEKRNYDHAMQEYQAALKKWEKYYPEDSKYFIRMRLQQVLEATKDVDYNAQLTERNGIKYFVKPEYEKKSANWKYAFRAGKEVTETVRAFVQQWIKEIN